MSCRSDVLYQHLLDDLSGFLPSSVLFDDCELPVDSTYKMFASNCLRKSFLKKFQDSISPEADQRALEKFLSVNKRCKEWSLQLSSSWDEVLLGELKNSLRNFWFKEGFSLVNSYEDYLHAGTLGPGANLLANGSDLYTKLFSSPLSATNAGLYDSYIYSFRSNSLWLNAEDFRTKLYGVTQIVEGSRLHFVPKTYDISRLICIEPTLNMFHQLGFGSVLQTRLREVFGIDFEDQPEFNRELARLGSETGRYITIDLESASDSLAIEMLQEVLPSQFLSWLKMFRCKQAELPSGEYVELNMISTMGNGTTFPLQTILFSCIVAACYRARGLKLLRNRRSVRFGSKCPGNFAVFGDDIIVDSSVSRDVLRLLEILGFQVNKSKTFLEGPFRESCGADFFGGQPVRGVYIKSLKTMADRFVAINRLNDWTAQTGIALPRTVSYLLRFVARYTVPLHENLDAGIRVPLAMATGQKWDKDIFAYRYKRFMPSTKSIRIYSDRVTVPRRVKKRCFNPFGLELAFLHGGLTSTKPNSIRKGVTKPRGYDAEISIRLDVILYNMRWGVSSSWDYSPASGLNHKQNNSHAHSLACYRNLDLWQVPALKA